MRESYSLRSNVSWNSTCGRIPTKKLRFSFFLKDVACFSPILLTRESFPQLISAFACIHTAFKVVSRKLKAFFLS